MSLSKPLTILVAAAALTACNMGGQAAAPVADVKAIEAQLREGEAQWNRDYAARDAAKLAGHYAPDAALANPGVALVSGGSAIAEAVKQFAADPNLKVEFASDRIQVSASGDLAYTRGHFSMGSTDPVTKKPRSDTGNYLTVWQKQGDGGWKAVEDFVVPDGGPSASGA